MMADDTNKQAVVVTDIRMPFFSMVIFMVKWAIAAIPALCILIVFGVLRGPMPCLLFPLECSTGLRPCGTIR